MRLSEIKNIYGTPLMESVQLADFRKSIEVMLSEANFLYRGIKNYAGAEETDIPHTYLFSPRSEPRTAKGNALAAAISESWTDLPPRNKSSFATGERRAAGRFGVLHICVPMYEGPFGISATDFNYSDGTRGLASLDDYLLTLFNALVGWVKDTSYTGEEVDRIARMIQQVPIDSHKIHPQPRYADPRTIAFYEYILDVIPDMPDEAFDTFLVSPKEDVEDIQNELGDHGAATYGELLTKLPPDAFGITRGETLADVPAGVGEVWWDKPYLAISISASADPETELEKVLRQL